jgi:hypothetical protein
LKIDSQAGAVAGWTMTLSSSGSDVGSRMIAWITLIVIRLCQGWKDNPPGQIRQVQRVAAALTGEDEIIILPSFANLARARARSEILIQGVSTTWATDWIYD